MFWKYLKRLSASFNQALEEHNDFHGKLKIHGVA
jgi:hypothetical protein